MSRVLLSDTLNTRDLGGYSIDAQKVTLKNVFLRSDAPTNVSEEDIKILLSNNITTIVDLRGDGEVQRKPCGFKDNKDFEYYHCKMYGDGSVPESIEAVPQSYFEMINEQTTILNIMRILAKPKKGVLYHCTAGKDRTGVISALLLLIAGVGKSEIIHDYQISQVYLDSMLHEFCKMNNNIDINIITPRKEYMENFLEMFLKKYSSVEEYLGQIGLSNEEIIGLKMKLVGM